MSNTPQEIYWEKKLERAAKALQENRFAASVHATGKEASEYLVGTVLGKDWKGDVNFGGSSSLIEAGVVPLLEAHPGVDVIPTWDPTIPREQIMPLRRQRYACDLYIASCNAVSMKGQLVNIDGGGNRVASIHYGPNKVVLFVGRNKLCETLEDAMTRARHVAAPINNLRLKRKNPCVATGRCMDCNSPERICNVFTITEKCPGPAERIHVLLVNEDLGF